MKLRGQIKLDTTYIQARIESSVCLHFISIIYSALLCYACVFLINYNSYLCRRSRWRLSETSVGISEFETPKHADTLSSLRDISLQFFWRCIAIWLRLLEFIVCGDFNTKTSLLGTRERRTSGSGYAYKCGERNSTRWYDTGIRRRSSSQSCAQYATHAIPCACVLKQPTTPIVKYISIQNCEQTIFRNIACARTMFRIICCLLFWIRVLDWNCESTNQEKINCIKFQIFLLH